MAASLVSAITAEAIGLSAKVAKAQSGLSRHQQGEELLQAAQGAARVRFRPIIMTSVAFIGGVSCADGRPEMAHLELGALIKYSLMSPFSFPKKNNNA